MGQLCQVQIEGVLLRKHHAQIEVHVQCVACQGQRENLILCRFGVVVIHAQGRFNQLLNLADGRRGVLGRLLDLGQEVVDKREHILQGAANHWQFHAVERLTGDRIAHKLKARANAADNVLETQVLEVEQFAQVRQDHHDRVGLDLTRKHQGLNVGRVHRVLVDHFDRTRIEGVQCLDGNFNVGGQRNVRPHAHVHLQAPQTGIGLALQVELHIVGAEFGEAETPVHGIGRVHIARQLNGGCRAQMHARVGSRPAGFGAEEAQLHADLQILGVQADAAREVDILHAQAELVFAQGERPLLCAGGNTVQFDLVLIHQTSDLEFLIADFQHIAHHGGVKDEGAVREQATVFGHGARLAKERATIQVEIQPQIALDEGIQAAFCRGGQHEAIDTQVEVEVHGLRRKLLPELQRHHEAALYRVVVDLHAQRQDARAVDRLHELLQRGDLLACLVNNGMHAFEAHGGRSAQLQAGGVQCVLDVVGANQHVCARHVAVQRDLRVA